MEECEVVLKIIDMEIDLLKDKNSKRIFVGGLSMGADMAIALYLRSNKELGGIVSFYGSNPLSHDHMPTINKASQIPILLFNNKWVLNEKDIEYTADYIQKQYLQETASGPKKVSTAFH